MSGIAGLVSFTELGLNPATCRAMLDAMPDRGVDAVGVSCAGRAALGHRIRWTTPHAAREGQPLRSADGRVQLVYDGRVDNRDELIAFLGAGADPTDGALLVELIAREGAAGLRRCVGEFALAWWSDDGRVVGLARDCLGMRPLYYAVTPRGLVWASELQALFVPGWISRRVNEGFIAEFLTTVPQSIDETPFEGVFRLPQAHVLEVTGARVEKRQYWTSRVHAEQRISDQDATEEFRSVLATAVDACLRARQPAAFQLSGGLDSSSIVAVAHARGVREPAAFSLVFPGDSSADETTYIQAVVRHTGARWFPSRPPELVEPIFGYVLAHEELPYIASSEPLMRGLLQDVAMRGHDVLLTGIGADEWLTESLSRTAALLRNGRVAAAARFVRDVRADYGRDWEWRLLLAGGLLPLVPAWIKAAAWRAAGRPRRDASPWIADAFAARTSLDDRLRGSFRRAPRVADPVVQESLVRLTAGEEAVVRHEAERMGTHAGVELRHPYYDRRLVEFVMSLPDDLRYRHRQAKYLTRRALSELLPRAVIDRRDKGDFTAAMCEIVRAACRRTDWDQLRSADLGWIVRPVIDRMRQELDGGTSVTPSRAQAAQVLWYVAALEAWLRTAFP